MRSAHLASAMACTAVGLMLAGCAAPLTQREKATLGGAALDASTGAISGETAGQHPEKGALIDGSPGAAGGALVGEGLEAERRRQLEYEREIDDLEREIRRQRAEIEELSRGAGYDDRYDDRYRDDDQYYDRDEGGYEDQYEDRYPEDY